MKQLLVTADRLLPGLLAISLLLVLFGIVSTSASVPSYWLSQLWVDAVRWGGGFLALGIVLQLVLPSHSRTLLLASGVLYLLHGFGWLQALAALTFFGACWCYGQALLLLVFPEANHRPLLTIPLILGLALQMALFGALLHYPVNYPALYRILQLLPWLILLRGEVREAFVRVPASLHHALHASAGRIPFYQYAVLLTVIGCVSRYLLLPTLSGDDNALHLRLWTELAWLHYATFDVLAQIWSVAPFALDLIHAIISLVAGEDARSAMNLCLFVLIARQLWAVLSRWQVPPRDCLLLLVLFTSTPLLGNLMVTLQTELFMALLASIGVRLLLEVPGSWYREQLLALIAVAALGCATKVPGIVLGLSLLLPALWQQWPLQRTDWSRHSMQSRLAFAGIILLCGFVAMHSYLTAWWITGNPLFPLYNGIFKSPYNDPWNFSDGRWLTGFNLTSYWNLFFTTSDHYESQNFVAGFQYLFLLPLGLFSLFQHLPRRQAWAVTVPLCGFGLAMFYNTQYWRYLFPVLPVAILVIATLLLHNKEWQWQRRAALASIVACIALNLWFYPGISYLLNIPPGTVYTAAGRYAVTPGYLVEKTMTAHVNQIAPGSRVLYQPDRPFGAILQGDPWYPMWYAPHRRDHANAIKNAGDLAAALKQEAIDYVVWNMSQAGMPLLRNYLSRSALPLKESTGVVLYELTAEDVNYRKAWQSPDIRLDQEPHLLHSLTLEGSTALRVGGSFLCSQDSGTIVLELAWNASSPTRRLIPCQPQATDYHETVFVPENTDTVAISMYGAETEEISASQLTLEVH